jgi:hypothetical protein
MYTLLNTSILTAYGKFAYEEITLEEAREWLTAEGFDSAIGHQSTADIMSTLLGVPVPVNRKTFIQTPGSQAIVFKLKDRAPEGVILTAEQIQAIGYTWGLLHMLES